MEFELTESTETFRKPVNIRTGGDLLTSWQFELDSYHKEMMQFDIKEPDDIFRCLSAWTARASFMRSQIVRAQSKKWQWFRTQEIDPFISECDRQFKIWSRVFSVQSLDWNMQRGQT